jgi:hypothetical protein
VRVNIQSSADVGGMPQNGLCTAVTLRCRGTIRGGGTSKQCKLGSVRESARGSCEDLNFAQTHVSDMAELLMSSQEQDRLAVEFKKFLLSLSEGSHIDDSICCYAHSIQRGSVRNGRDDQRS